MSTSAVTQEAFNLFDVLPKWDHFAFSTKGPAIKFLNSNGYSSNLSNTVNFEGFGGFGGEKGKPKVFASLLLSKSSARIQRILNDFNRAVQLHCDRIPLGFGSIGLSTGESGMRENGGGMLEGQGFNLNGVGVEKPKKILILMSDTGGGHRASAEAIKVAFHEEFGEEYQIYCDSVIIDMAPMVDTNGMRGMKKAELLKRLEGGLVPYNEIKQLIKVQLERRLQWGYKPTYEQQIAQLLNFAHYQSTTLERAEILMLDLYCEKAQINDGMSVLDLGCGHGSLTLHIARKYKNCHVMAITNSVSQKEYIEERCKYYNLSNVDVILEDVMKHDMVETFDRIMVIGLFEHMKNYELFLRKISKWMSQDGLLFVDHLCHKTFPYHFEPLDDDDWYTEYVFAGDAIIIPSASFLLYFQDDVSVVDHWILSGKHFSRSNEEWLKRLDTQVDAIKVVLERSLGSEEAVMKLINYFRGFFLSGMEMFGYNNGEEWMISHVLFKKK